MIRPEGFGGAAFGDASDGDGRSDPAARRRIAESIGISADWAYVDQIHGARVVEARTTGSCGEADAIITGVPGLPLAVATADCVPIILEGPGVAGVVHAGWRGLAAGVIGATLAAIGERGLVVERAAIGPAIGPCCYEVGPEVADRFEGFTDVTKGGGRSVDLGAVAASQLGGVVAYRSDDCTRCGEGYHSFRRNATAARQVAVAWLAQA